MKRKWQIALLVIVLCAVALLIWNGTAERRYVAAVRKLEWSEEWAQASGNQLMLDQTGSPWNRTQVTVPEQQRLLFDGLKSLRYEGKYKDSFAFFADEEGYQITFHGTEVGWVSLCLLAEPAQPYDSRPRYALQYGNESISVSGAEELVRIAQTLLGVQ